MSDKNEFGAFFAGLMVGGLIGAAVALLTAPQSGEETRTLIKDRGIELKDKAYEYGQDVSTRTSKALEDAVARLDQSVSDMRVRLDELSRSISTKTKGATPPPPAE